MEKIIIICPFMKFDFLCILNRKCINNKSYILISNKIREKTKHITILIWHSHFVSLEFPPPPLPSFCDI